MPEKKRFIELLDKYTANEISTAEQDELFFYIDSSVFDTLIPSHILANLNQDKVIGTKLSSSRAQAILQNILATEKQTAKIITGYAFSKKLIRWSVAAAILGVMSLSAYWVIFNHSNKTSELFAGKHTLEKINHENHAIQIALEDSSMVTLQPGSGIKYPDHFDGEKREIYLTGEAFFEVSKHPERPFFVYNHDIVTHVLGTSFNVKMDLVKKQLEVTVKTGRVRVYEKLAVTGNAVNKQKNGVVLLPNQKVVYYEENRQFVSSLVDMPLPVIDKEDPANKLVMDFVYDEARLENILNTLQKIYGIEILVENEQLNNCLFTGDITSKDLYTKLDLICQATSATYEVVGTKILIKGKGCN